MLYHHDSCLIMKRYFLSRLSQEAGILLIFTKTIYTIAQHPQTDEFVERFNRSRTLNDMFAKSAELNGKKCNEKLSYVLFAYKLLHKSPLVNHLFNCIRSYTLERCLMLPGPCIQIIETSSN